MLKHFITTSQSIYKTKERHTYTPLFFGAPRGTLTPNTWFRRGDQKLLRVQLFVSYFIIKYHIKNLSNPFIYQHFSHFILSNSIIQYFPLKIQYKTPHLQKSCIFLAKICSSGFIIQTLLICHKCFLWNLLDYYKHIQY